MPASVELITTPQPHLIPGYTGFCPRSRFIAGKNYGNITHEILKDRNIENPKTVLVLSDNKSPDKEVKRPRKYDIDLVMKRNQEIDSKYTHPMNTGYTGYVPNEKNVVGQTFMNLATEGVAEFERDKLKRKICRERLRQLILYQDVENRKRGLYDKSGEETNRVFPAVDIKPERARLVRAVPVDEPHLAPKDHALSPYFMDCLNPNKYFISSYSGHVPFGYSQVGVVKHSGMKDALCEFTSIYRKNKSNQWSPTYIPQPELPLDKQPYTIYHKNIGLLPNYRGHIPGEKFRCGKTFGADTKDVKRWLRGEFE